MPDPTSDRPNSEGQPSTALQPVTLTRVQPGWRRAIRQIFKFLIIGIVGFLLLSVGLVALIGWTGPPPTINMALKALDGATIRQTWRPLGSISPNLARAVIAAEDTRFCTHQGFDLVEIQKAIEAAERGRNLRGASTISQQTAKNVFLYNGGGFVRKGLEAWFTVLIETMWSKRRIMEVYLNIAEWGDGVYGAEAAAQARFGIPASKLTSRQSSLLAAVLPSPNRWKVNGRYAGRRSGRIQAVMNAVRRDGLDRCLTTDE